MAKAPLTTQAAEDKMRKASAARYPGTVKPGEATGPDPYVSRLRKQVASGAFASPAPATKSKEAARDKSPGR